MSWFLRVETSSAILLAAALLVTALSLSPAGAVAAQEGTEMLLFQEIPSVFSASKYEQKVSEAPASVSIVTATEIKRYGYRTLGEILASLRGFYLSSDRNYEYLWVRGFSRPGDYNSRVLLLVDGLRVNDNIYDTAATGTEFLLDVDLIERVEVVRGPGSSLYGANAFFAVVNVITKRGRDLKGTEAAAEVGSFAARRGRLTYGERFGGTWEVLVSGTIYRSDGERSIYFPEYDDPETHFGVARDGDGDRVHSLFGKFSVRDLTLSAAFSRRKKEVPTGAYEVVFNDPRNHNVDEQAFAQVQYAPQLAGGELHARAYYGHYYFDGDYVYEEPEAGQFINRDEARGQWLGTEVHFTRPWFDRHKITLGGEYRRNLRQDQRNFDFEINLDDRRDSDNWGIFIQDEWLLHPRLRFHAGLRYDRFYTGGSSTNPRLALIYQPYDRTTLKLLYGEAFRAPNAFELHYHDGPSTQRTNPDLGPETIRTYELIWEQAIGNNLRGVTNAFYYRIEDLITLQLGEDDLTVFRNVEEVEAFGIETELEGRWENGLEGRLSYSWQQAVEKGTSAWLSNSPRHLAKLNLILPLRPDRLYLGLEERFVSSRRTLTGDRVGSFAVTHLNLTLEDLLPRLDISAGVFNLFDRHWRDPGSVEHRQEGLPQPGRTYRLKVSYLF